MASPPTEAAGEPGERLEMGISHADFERIFPRVVAPLAVQRDGLAWRVNWPDGARLEVVLSPERCRRLAGLGIVYCEVALHYAGFTTAGRERFRTAFMRAFHKGGG